jgi:hypothetical protein
LKVLKLNVSFRIRADSILVFGCLFVKELKFLLASMKSLTENPSSNTLQEACSDFPIDTKRVKVDPEIRKPATNVQHCTLEKIDQ